MGNTIELSAEARAYVAEREVWWGQNPPPGERITLENASRIRAEHRAEYQAGCDAAVAETGATLTELELGGVRTLRLEVERLSEGAVLYFFGGAFVSGGPDLDLTITAPLAAALGVPIYGPHYPLSPEHKFPAALESGVAAYRSLLEKTPSHQIAVVGESAGGNLALTVALSAIQQGLPAPASVVALSPWADLTMTGHSQEMNVDPSMKIESDWEHLARSYAGDTPLTDPLVSPVNADYRPGFPPTLVTTGTRDLLLSDCVRLTTAMRRASVDSTIHVWEGMWHVFEHNYGLPEGKRSIAEIAGFVKRHLAGHS